MTNYKQHLAGTNKTKAGRNLPTCGKVSSAIEYDTLNKEDFKKLDVTNRCKNCNSLH